MKHKLWILKSDEPSCKTLNVYSTSIINSIPPLKITNKKSKMKYMTTIWCLDGLASRLSWSWRSRAGIQPCKVTWLAATLNLEYFIYSIGKKQLNFFPLGLSFVCSGSAQIGADLVSPKLPRENWPDDDCHPPPLPKQEAFSWGHKILHTFTHIADWLWLANIEFWKDLVWEGQKYLY